MAFTVTATQGGNTGLGMAMVVTVITGQSASQPGTVGGIQSATPNLSITPGTTGSWVYGALLLSGTGGVAGETGVTLQQSVTNGGLRFIAMRSTSTQTGGTPILMGTTTGTGLAISLVEIKPGTGLAESASSPPLPGAVGTSSQTCASFTPPAGSLLLVSVATNGGTGTTTMAISDTSGLGLTWVEQQKENGSSKGYTGLWTALVPAPPAAKKAHGGSIVPSLIAAGVLS